MPSFLRKFKRRLKLRNSQTCPSFQDEMETDRLKRCVSGSLVSPRIGSLSTANLSPSMSVNKMNAELATDCECFLARHACDVLKRLDNMRRCETLCDVILLVNGKRIPAHRNILASCSSYFDAMFSNNMIESKLNEIRIHEVDTKAFEMCIDYIYTGQLKVTEECVETLLQTSGLLQLSDVIEYCSSFLMQQFHPANCLGIRQFAENQGVHDLYAAANSYTLDNFSKVVSQSEYAQVNIDDLLNLIESDDLNVMTEEQVFDAICRWINFDYDARYVYLYQLLSLVRLPLITPMFLTEYVEPFAAKSPECQSLIMEALRYHVIVPKNNVNTIRMRARKSTVGFLIAVGGQCSSNKLMTIEYYSPRTNEWKNLDEMKSRRLQFGCALHNEKIHIIGGRDGLKTLATVNIYDLRERIWSQGENMVAPRHGLGVCSLEGPIYAIGGHDGWSFLNTVERWDPLTCQWNLITHMNVARSTHAVTVHKGRIYAIGGRDGSSCLNSVECYDPFRSRWSSVASLSTRRAGCAAASFNSFIYVVGGYTYDQQNNDNASVVNQIILSSVERYNAETDQWTTINPTPSPLTAAGLCVLGERLYLCGGHENGRTLHDTYAYDPQTETWSPMASLNSARVGLAVIHVRNCCLSYN